MSTWVPKKFYKSKDLSLSHLQQVHDLIPTYIKSLKSVIVKSLEDVTDEGAILNVFTTRKTASRFDILALNNHIVFGDWSHK